MYNNKEAVWSISILVFQSIVPPTWIVKIPPKGNFKNSLKACPLKGRNGEVIKVPPLATVQENAVNKIAGKKDEKKDNSKNIKEFFCIKPIPENNLSPLLVFLNPKSGGNQGAKLFMKFQSLLNPRQVFDLTKGGPGPAIELFRYLEI